MAQMFLMKASAAERVVKRGCGETARAAIPTVDASLFEGAAIVPRLQRLGCELSTPNTVLTLDADQSSPEAAAHFVQRDRGHD
jgi:hypothetical protein